MEATVEREYASASADDLPESFDFDFDPGLLDFLGSFDSHDHLDEGYDEPTEYETDLPSVPPPITYAPQSDTQALDSYRKHLESFSSRCHSYGVAYDRSVVQSVKVPISPCLDGPRPGTTEYRRRATDRWLKKRDRRVFKKKCVSAAKREFAEGRVRKNGRFVKSSSSGFVSISEATQRDLS
eukprot:CAMPEP_0116929976 /NCGR_PEP_ID=MMETSP0467-20121206/26911_1 /TAXON_ID=283647 /ORGANISM="Mesodinium pulex, Strain SPMC105" /LENGTH=181 /DNA_ID=CAMNT_0004610067 /DNA_START=97 /DNA_END=642 /DNA_ORIENTATION=-